MALSRLADVGHLEGVTNILKGPLTACPELVLLGLAAAAPHSDRRILQTRMAQPLALRFAAQAAQGSPASQALMHQLRDINGVLTWPASCLKADSLAYKLQPPSCCKDMC